MTRSSSSTGLTAKDLTELERFGLVESRTLGDTSYYDEDALLVATLAAGFLGHGVEARHLRMYKVAAEREAGMFEQLVMPLLKQRNPGRPDPGHRAPRRAGLPRRPAARRHVAPSPGRAPGPGLIRPGPGASAGREHKGTGRVGRGRSYRAGVIEMEVVGVRVELPSNTPIVLLREVEGLHRMLPIFIGGPEATAIALALDDVSTPRPMTHDLMKNMLTEFEVAFERLDITSLAEGTFYAELHLRRGRQAPGDLEPPIRRHRPGDPHGDADLRRRGGHRGRRPTRSTTRPSPRTSSSSSGSSSTA